MRTPQRKAGKYTHRTKDHHITEEKYNELKKEYTKLKERIRPHLIAEVKRLALDGDFSENAAYQIAKGRLRGLNHRLDEIQEMLAKSIIIHKNKDSDTVGLGSTVTIKQNNKKRTFTILGSSEVDPGGGVISHNSPIGKALMGKRVGDSYDYEANGKKISGEVVEVG